MPRRRRRNAGKTQRYRRAAGLSVSSRKSAGRFQMHEETDEMGRTVYVVTGFEGKIKSGPRAGQPKTKRFFNLENAQGFLDRRAGEYSGARLDRGKDWDDKPVRKKRATTKKPKTTRRKKKAKA